MENKKKDDIFKKLSEKIDSNLENLIEYEEFEKSKRFKVLKHFEVNDEYYFPNLFEIQFNIIIAEYNHCLIEGYDLSNEFIEKYKELKICKDKEVSNFGSYNCDVYEEYCKIIENYIKL